MTSSRTSSAGEYACWYLEREVKKHGRGHIPRDHEEALHTLASEHGGKWRWWFPTAHWTLEEIGLSAFENLIFPEVKWSLDEGLVVNDGADYRLLKRVASNASGGDYISRYSATKHNYYFELMRTGAYRLVSENRIALCSANENEKRANPSGLFYLLDGAGRSLPYMMLVRAKTIEYSPIEAFVATRTEALQPDEC